MIRLAKQEEIDSIIQIEQRCFPKAEAATKNQLKLRFATFPECFLIYEDQHKIIGYIAGASSNQLELPDEFYHDASLHQKDGKYQTVFSLAVLPEYRNQGIATQLMSQFIDLSQQRGKSGMILTCKDYLISYYEKCGFQHRGVSSSCHGNAKWNDMILLF